MPSDEPSRPYNWRRKSLAKLKQYNSFSYLKRLGKILPVIFSEFLIKKASVRPYEGK
jgi:hypothetical protein